MTTGRAAQSRRNMASWDAIWDQVNDHWFQSSEFRTTILEKTMALWKPGAVFLDVGCGAGEYVEELQSKGYRAFGLDISFSALQNGNRSRLICSQADILPIKPNKIDCVLAVLVLEHVRDETAILQELIKTIADDGIIVIIVPRIFSVVGFYLHLIQPLIKRMRGLFKKITVLDRIPIHRTFRERDIRNWAKIPQTKILEVDRIFATAYTQNIVARLYARIMRLFGLRIFAEEFFVVLKKWLSETDEVVRVEHEEKTEDK